MEADEAEAIFDEFAGAYRDWWGPLIAPAAVRVLDDLEARTPGERFDLLDIGTGTGVLAAAALQRWPGAQVVGIDPSGRMLELAEDAARGVSPSGSGRLRTIVASADRIPAANASFDAAVSSFVIQLVPSRAAALREILRVLRPGATFACITWQTDDPAFEPDEAFVDALDELRISSPSADRDIHPYTSPRSAADEFRRAGFRAVRASRDWLEHRFTPESYLLLLEHWIDRELFAGLDATTREELRAEALSRMRRLRADEFIWRRPLVRVVASKPPG